MSDSAAILFKLDGHANNLGELRHALAEALLLISAQDNEPFNNAIAQGAKFTLFDAGYHTTLNLRLDGPWPPDYPPDSIAEDDDPHDFDEIRAGHLGDTP